MSIRLFVLLCLTLAVGLSGCSRFATRSGTAPILEPQAPPPPRPIEMDIAPPAESPSGPDGVALPAGTALPARKSY